MLVAVLLILREHLRVLLPPRGITDVGEHPDSAAHPRAGSQTLVAGRDDARIADMVRVLDARQVYRQLPVIAGQFRWLTGWSDKIRECQPDSRKPEIEEVVVIIVQFDAEAGQVAGIRQLVWITGIVRPKLARILSAPITAAAAAKPELRQPDAGI